jgi:transcription initiation factor TFIID subunit 7
MKLKLTAKPVAADGAPAVAPASPSILTPTSATGAPKLKFKTLATAPVTDESGSQPKPKRKYTKKAKGEENAPMPTPASKAAKTQKHPREESGEDVSLVAKRKPKPTAKSLERIHSSEDEEDVINLPTVAVTPRAPVRTGSVLKVKLKPAANGQSGLQRSSTAMIKIKGVHGKPPVRPPGVGYDSEAEEAEEDPAIESQFVLRMQPGPDCDLLRKAIEDKTIGHPAAKGGTSVHFRFFDKEGRRALIAIQGRLYAACMVDLPCVIESMKSWNKKDWVKTADICQMLLVLGRVQTEDEAKKFPLPRDVNNNTYQYAHGLTPPMQHVRKRRFRPRASFHRVEEIESQVTALLDFDRKAASSDYQIIEEGAGDSDETSEEGEGDEDEEDDVEETTEYVLEGETPGGEEIEIDAPTQAELAEMLEAGLADEDDVDVDALFGGGDAMEVETPATSHDVAMNALGENAPPETETAASTPAVATSPDDEDEDDEDDDAESPPDEVDAEAAAAAAVREQDMLEMRELEEDLADIRKQYESSTNVIFKQRTKVKIAKILEDLNLKRATLGLDEAE